MWKNKAEEMRRKNPGMYKSRKDKIRKSQTLTSSYVHDENPDSKKETAPSLGRDQDGANKNGDDALSEMKELAKSMREMADRVDRIVESLRP